MKKHESFKVVGNSSPRKFVKYFVIGIRPKENGHQPPPFKRSGIIADTPEIYGVIFSRHPELCDCIRLRVSAYKLNKKEAI